MLMIEIYDQTKLKQHPELQCIPWSIWRGEFDFFIRENYLKLIRKPFAEAIKHLPDEALDKKEIYCLIYANGQNLNEEMIDSLYSKAKQKEDILNALAYLGRLDLLKYFYSKENQSVSSEKAFIIAAENGNKAILECLIALAPDKTLQMIKASNYGAFRSAARNGHKAILEYLVELAPDEATKHWMIKSGLGGDYWAFSLAAKNGHKAILEYLIELAPDEETKYRMIKGDDYEAFFYAASNGHKAILEYLIELAPDKKLQMIQAAENSVFREAASKGHKAILEYLIALAPDEETKLKMIKDNDYQAFSSAVSNGHKAILEYLVSLAPDEETKLEMIKANGYRAFSSAAQSGHKAILEYLVSLAPDEETKLEMINARPLSSTFSSAAQNGHKAILEYLVSLAPDEETKLEMIKANNYAAFQLATRNGHIDTVNYLLSFPECLSYAEMHVLEYGERFVYPFIEARLQMLDEAEDTYYHEHPSGVFDISNESEARLGFYILRSLIRINDESLIDDINFLLNIPAIKALAHTEVTANQSNELLRLAITEGNQPAIERLLQIPAVRELAEQNNFYADEMRGNLDLRALAEDAESSMTALTQGEQQRLEKLRVHYQQDINDLGQDNLFRALKEELKERYLESPATIEVDGKKITLPFDWQAFQNLKLQGNVKEQALNAYYQHDVHSAYRYLSKPNHWMASNVSYVYISNDRNERWSTFEEYKPLIVLFYRAAFDDNKKMAPKDGHDLQGRINHFINELAHIGRAHNWDKKRHARNKKTGELLYKKNNEGQSFAVMEEYDDLKGDKPSCFSGVKRRLFQSVVGHPLLSIFSKEVLNQEIREFLYEHFENHINEDNIQGIQGAIEALMEAEPLTQEQEKALAELDVSNEAQERFIKDMKEKYGEELRKEPHLKLWLKNEFKLTGGNTCHVFQFYTLTNFDELLKHKEAQLNQLKKKDKGKAPIKPASVVKQSVFSRQKGPDSDEPGPSSRKQPPT
jgi:ankyrin repeat protein